MGEENTNQGENVTVPTEADTAGAVEDKITLDKFLSTPENKASYDAAIAAAVEEELNKKEAQEEEARRREKLTAEERTAEKEKELEERENRLRAAELKSEAVLALSKAGVPVQLAECLNYSDKEAYEKGRDALLEAFKEGVQAGVNERLRGKNIPVADSGNGNGASLSAPSANDLKELIKKTQVKR